MSTKVRQEAIEESEMAESVCQANCAACDPASDKADYCSHVAEGGDQPGVLIGGTLADALEKLYRFRSRPTPGCPIPVHTVSP